MAVLIVINGVGSAAAAVQIMILCGGVLKVLLRAAG